MNSKIFRSSIFTTLLVLAATFVLIMGVLLSFFEKQIMTEIESETLYISHAVENEGLDFFDGFDGVDKRVTIIDEHGDVIFDNKADAVSLDNHADREEIKQAMEYGTGMSTRYSKTLTEKTVYYAVKLSDGNILRVSTNQYTAVAILLGLIQPVCIVLIAAFILTFILSSRVSKSIVNPINEIDPDDPENNDVYEELAPLLGKIAAQKRMIERQLDEAVRKQKEFNMITENMSEGFLVIDKNAALLTHNSAALKLLDIEIGAAESKSVFALCREHNFREAVEKALCGTKAESRMTQGSRVYSLIASPVFENEDVIGAVIIIIDVTESEEREALRREFTANVSHELKTPLTSISGFAELMKEGDVPKETAADFSHSIYDEAQRLITLVNDIIKISELDEKSIPAEKENVDLYELANEIAARLKAEADKKNVSLNVIGESAEIPGVRYILDEMIYNLCDNAIKYNKENGIADIIITSSDKKVSLTVRDTGIGIPPEHKSRVFERFYRVDKSHSKRVGGTGLGLAIVKHGAMYHNAEIKLESTEGKGTSVTIEFDKEQSYK